MTKQYKVLADSWGTYVKGDIVEMHPSTGAIIEAKKIVKEYKPRKKKED